MDPRGSDLRCGGGTDLYQFNGNNPVAYTDPLPDSVQFRVEESRAIPGLTYTWGTYEPPGTADLLFTSVAGLWDSGGRVLRTSKDWFEVIARRRWAATSAEEAIRACGEVIAYAGPRRDIAIRPIVYEGPSTLNQGFAVDRDSLSSRLDPPRASSAGNDESRAVLLWALEGGQTTRYQCTLGPEGGGSLAVQDSIYGPGLLPRGP